MPDPEAICIAVLLADEACAEVLGQHVYGTLPPGFDAWPAVRVTQWGGTQGSSGPPVLGIASIQVDVFGALDTGKGPPARAAELCRNALACTAPGNYADGSVTDAVCSEKAYQPDETYTPARPRYRFDVALTIRPKRRVPA